MHIKSMFVFHKRQENRAIIRILLWNIDKFTIICTLCLGNVLKKGATNAARLPRVCPLGLQRSFCYSALFWSLGRGDFPTEQA